MKSKKISLILFLVMVGSFFLPWIAIGFVHKSLWELFFYLPELSRTIEIMTAKPSPLEDFLWLRYGVLFFPVMAGLLWVKHLRVVVAWMGLLSGLTLFVLFSLLSPPLWGWGMIVYLFSTALFLSLYRR